MYRFLKQTVTITYLGIFVLLLPACQAPSPATARDEWGGGTKDGLAEPAEPVKQDDAPRRDRSQPKTEPEEPAGAVVNDRARQPSLSLESAPDSAVSSAEETPEVSQPETDKTAGGERRATETAEAHAGETQHPAGDDGAAAPADDGQVAHDRAADEATTAATEPRDTGGSEAPEGARPFKAERANAEPPTLQPLVPVIPAKVQKTASGESAEIAYPEAPPPVAVSKEQIDALSLPATDPKRPIIGIWVQIGGGNSADFADGNYGRAVLIFRTDGVLEIVRWFGPRHEIRLDSKFTYTVTKNQSIRVELPSGVSVGTRQAYSIPVGDGKSVRIEPATATFPTDLTYQRGEGRLTIEAKTYRRASKK